LRKERKIKPFHQLKSPNITEQNKTDRVKLARYLNIQFMNEPDLINNFIFCDEFYVYVERKPNSKNDIIWSKDINDIPENIRYRKVKKNPKCLGILVAVSKYNMFYKLKNDGCSWDGSYFRRQIIHKLHNWIDDEYVVDDKNKTVIIHDCGPGWAANATQNLLKQHFGPNGFIPARDMDDNIYPRWPGNSPDLNIVENVGAVIKDEVDDMMLDVDNGYRYIDVDELKDMIEITINSIASDAHYLSKCVLSFINRCKKVVTVRGAKLQC
jgi:hypothetical protein